MTTWQLQTAKQRFSELVRAAQAGEPQVVSKRGEPVVVVIDIEEFRRIHDPRPPLADFLLAGLDTEGLELPDRQVDDDRHPDLFGVEA